MLPVYPIRPFLPSFRRQSYSNRLARLAKQESSCLLHFILLLMDDKKRAQMVMHNRKMFLRMAPGGLGATAGESGCVMEVER